jgi:hypothetical protein
MGNHIVCRAIVVARVAWLAAHHRVRDAACAQTLNHLPARINGSGAARHRRVAKAMLRAGLGPAH